MKVAFLLQDLQLSGGTGVVVEHASQLASRHDFDVTLAMTRTQPEPDWTYRGLKHLHVMPLSEAVRGEYDVAVATWWETAFHLFDLQARRHAYFVQSLEDRFYPPEDDRRLAAASTHAFPVRFITEARWIAETFDRVQPASRPLYVRNGVAKDVFRIAERVEPRHEPPLRVLIEGNPDVWFKGVGDALASVRAMREERKVTVVVPQRMAPERFAGADRVVGPLGQQELADLYGETDVVLKLSRVEGMFGPPLEGFHCGATCVVTPVTGHEEFVEHGWNGLVTDWEDAAGTARLLDLLARDRRLLNFLRTNAVETARAWPSWEQAGEMMAAALHRIAAEPAPAAGDSGTRIGYDTLAALQAYRLRLEARERELIDQFTSIRAYQFGVTLRRWMHRLRGWVTAPLRVVSALRARLRRGG